MPAPMQQPSATARCEPRGASFVLIGPTLADDGSGRAGTVTIEPHELLRWVLVAAEYSEGFHAALQKRLASIHSKTDGSAPDAT